MNIEQAKQIAIVEILNKLGHQPTRKGAHEYAYLSPLRHEKTSSFFVNIQKNLWHDKGIDVGGNIITFGVKYLESQGKPHTVSDALKFLSDVTGHISFIKPVEADIAEAIEEEKMLILKGVFPLNHPALIEYLSTRGITTKIAKIYLKQLYILNKSSEKKFCAIGIENESENFEYRNKFMKGSLGPKDITFIRGRNANRQNITRLAIQDEINRFHYY